MTLSKDRHTIADQAADAELMKHIGQDIFLPFEDRIEESDRQIFLDHIQKQDHDWFFIHLKGNDELYAVKLQDMPHDLHFQIAKASDLVQNISDQTDLNECYAALCAMYGDVYFIYHINSDHIHVHSSGCAFLVSRRYAVTEFEQFMIEHTKDDQKAEMKEMLTEMKQGISCSIRSFSGNYVDDDEKAEHTVFQFSTITHHDQSADVIGLIHAERKRRYPEKEMARRDGLTGLYAKQEIERIAKESIAAEDGREFSLGIMDIDFFKNINDTYGHAAGDKVLHQIGLILQAEVGQDGSVGRIGGDEFMILANDTDETHLRNLYSDIRTQVANSFPSYGLEEKAVTLSIGSASYPISCKDYETLFFLADHCLYRAKKQGRDRYVIYTPSKHGSVEDILRRGYLGDTISGRQDMDPAEAIVNMICSTSFEKQRDLSSLLDEFAHAMKIQNVMIAYGNPAKIGYTAGEDALHDEKELQDIAAALSQNRVIWKADDFVIISSLENIGEASAQMKEKLRQAGILSFVTFRFQDAEKKDALLILTSIGKKQKWNQMHLKYYRIFAELLKKYIL
ncbi:MAG: GGDEF domain-containing protein [Solobacterium sp.]|jgi:diguanylate cyclase (GGDEF)-like protein|nr:GGDEF domain-containing protein [Solobacterium sp.]MCH4282562.1 GGDEF domain-containing protein [Solobacterium sp.]